MSLSFIIVLCFFEVVSCVYLESVFTLSGEAKSLLLGFALGASHRGSSIRKITPLTTEATSVVAISGKQLQVTIPISVKQY